MTIVTADGNYLTVNENRYPDLFWALRGGGGGSWGVMTSVTYLTHPNSQFSGVFFQAMLSESNNTNPNATQNLAEELIRMTPSLVDLGFGGMAYFSRPLVYFYWASPKATWTQTNDTFYPFFEYAANQAKTGGLVIQDSISSFPSFETAFQAMVGHVVDITGSTVGVNSEVSSWILPPEAVTSDPGSVASALIDMSALYL
jgi:hypothetical protein